jgi:hypothetical protein
MNVMLWIWYVKSKGVKRLACHFTNIEINYNVKITVFRDVAPCSLVEIDRLFRGSYCVHHQSTHRPDDGGSKHF